MAVYRDIDADVRIGGSLTLPAGPLILNGTNVLTSLNAKANSTITLTAGTGLSGGGNLTANRTLSVTFGTIAGTVSEGNHVHTYESLTSKPTTLAGYGITDASASGHVHTFASLTSKPTTLVGFGITDAAPISHSHDNLYYTETEIDTKLNQKMSYGDVLMNTNPFGGKQLFINSVNNAIFRAESRWILTGTLYNGDGTVSDTYNEASLAGLFDGNYEGGLIIPAGKYVIININFNNGTFPGYPYGNLYLSHYHVNESASAKLRTYSTYEPHVIGWHEYDFAGFGTVTDGATILKARNSVYAITQMEFEIYAPATENATVTQIDWQLDRPGSNEMPLVDKYRANSLYSQLAFKDTTNTTNAYINNNGHADFKGLKIEGVNVSLIGHSHDDLYYTETEMETKLSLKSDTGHAHAISDITSLQSTLDGKSETGHVHTFTSLTSKPTTLSGYGITDAATLGHNHTLDALSNTTVTSIASGHFIKWSGTAWVNSLLVAADIPSIAWSKITSGKPTTLAGYGITDSAALAHNHSWEDITSGKPTTLAGYGITDASLSSHHHDSIYTKRGTRPESVRALDKRVYTPTDVSTALGEVQFTFTSLNNDGVGPFADGMIMSTYLDGSGGGTSMLLFEKEGAGVYHRYGAWNGADWLWTKKLAYDQDKVDKTTSIIAGTGLTGGGDLTIDRTLAVNFGTTAGTVAQGNHVHTTAQVTGLDTVLSNKSDVSHTHTFASLTTKPTTLAGYGITDASLSNHVHTFASLTSKPTTLVGYGITDAATSTHNHNTLYLGITAKAVDSDKLNGQLASFYTESSAFTTHTGDATIHKNWGNWTPSVNDLLVNSKRAVVHVPATNKLMINYAGDFLGGVEIAGPLTTGGFAIWHAGNLSTNDFVSTSTAATLAGNLTVKGRIWAGDASAAGSLVIKDGANQNAIHLGGTTALSNVKTFISDTGSAKFNGAVQVGSLILDSTALVPKLNAEFVGGSKETEFVRTYSIRDNRGYGVHSGLEVVQKSPTPDMTVQVRPGIAYSDSGRRFEWTADEVVPISQASANYDRIDIVFIHGKTAAANEGSVDLLKGLADRVTPIPPTASIPVGSIVLAHVYVKANIGTITDGTSGTFDAIDNAPKTMASIRLAEGVSYSINEPIYGGSDIYEKGEKLEDKYAEVAKANTFTGNQDIDGRVKVQSTGSLNGVPGSANYYIRVTDGTNILAIDPDEIVTTGAMNLTAGSVMILSAGAGNSIIDMNGKMKASKNAITLTIPAGQTSVTWTHNYGSNTYAVNPVSNSFERHVRWTDKLANTIVIEIDDISSQETLVDCILIGY